MKSCRNPYRQLNCSKITFQNQKFRSLLSSLFVSICFLITASAHADGRLLGGNVSQPLQLSIVTGEMLTKAGGDLYLSRPSPKTPDAPYISVAYDRYHQQLALDCGNVQITELNRAFLLNPTLMNLSTDIRILAENPFPHEVNHSDGSSSLWQLAFVKDHILIELFLKSENGKCLVTNADELTNTTIFQTRINDAVKDVSQASAYNAAIANANAAAVERRSGSSHLVPMPLHTVITNNQ